MNLYEILKRNSFRGLLLSQIKQYAFQILECMALLYQSHVIHCDLKPENILVSDSCRNFVKVIDFGSSCFSNQRVYSYIQSRFYRAPEIVLGIPYTTAIDMWSLGCILVELYTGLPIFPCEDEKELIACIVEVIGEPPTDVIGQSTRSGLFFNADGELISCANSKGKKRLPRTRSIKSILKGAENEFINVIESCLLWNPKLRITPEAAMKLDWFVESNNSIKSKNKRKYKISMEDITKHTPQLQKFMAHRNKNTK
jgi:dual specificity tyrosine-phosphorylation-regulated kinase 2/3/4